MILFNGRVEMYWRDGSWFRPAEWIFETYVYPCGTGCRTIECGCFTVYLNKGACALAVQKEKTNG